MNKKKMRPPYSLTLMGMLVIIVAFILPYSVGNLFALIIGIILFSFNVLRCFLWENEERLK